MFDPVKFHNKFNLDTEIPSDNDKFISLILEIDEYIIETNGSILTINILVFENYSFVYKQPPIHNKYTAIFQLIINSVDTSYYYRICTDINFDDYLINGLSQLDMGDLYYNIDYMIEKGQLELSGMLRKKKIEKLLC